MTPCSCWECTGMALRTGRTLLQTSGEPTSCQRSGSVCLPVCPSVSGLILGAARAADEPRARQHSVFRVCVCVSLSVCVCVCVCVCRAHLQFAASMCVPASEIHIFQQALQPHTKAAFLPLPFPSLPPLPATPPSSTHVPEEQQRSRLGCTSSLPAPPQAFVCLTVCLWFYGTSHSAWVM